MRPSTMRTTADIWPTSPPDQFRHVAAAHRGEIVPQRSQAQPARRSRARHAEGAVERTFRVRYALQIRDAVAREERRRLRLGVHVDEDHRRPAVGHRRSPRRDVGHHLLAQRTPEVPQEDEQQRAARGAATPACRRRRCASRAGPDQGWMGTWWYAARSGRSQECTSGWSGEDGLPSTAVTSRSAVGARFSTKAPRNQAAPLGHFICTSCARSQWAPRMTRVA